MPVLLGHPHLLLRDALQLIARIETTTNNINKARFTFFIKILRFVMFNKFERVISNPIHLIIHNTKLNYFHQ
jgi:hypothetical protein